MKKTLILCLLIASSNAFASSSYQRSLDTVQAVCPDCKISIETIMLALNKKCDFPLTAENVLYIAETHPIYPVSMVLNAILGENRNIQSLITETATCRNDDEWVNDLRVKLMERSL